MNATFTGRISQYLTQLQSELFPVLREDLELELSPALEKVIRVLEFVQVERFIPSSRGFIGAPPKDSGRLAFFAGLRRVCCGTLAGPGA